MLVELDSSRMPGGRCGEPGEKYVASTPAALSLDPWGATFAMTRGMSPGPATGDLVITRPVDTGLIRLFIRQSGEVGARPQLRDSQLDRVWAAGLPPPHVLIAAVHPSVGGRRRVRRPPANAWFLRGRLLPRSAALHARQDTRVVHRRIDGVRTSLVCAGLLPATVYSVDVPPAGEV